jgi:SAM-dependent methyltransferase
MCSGAEVAHAASRLRRSGQLSEQAVSSSAPAIELSAPTLLHGESAFSRLDETDDAQFYATPRPGPHLDSTALGTIRRVVSRLVTEPRPRVLDLMAGTDSHLPAGLGAARVVGLGMNRAELDANPRLTEQVVHDLNARPALPFDDRDFDVVLCTVSVGYLAHPFEVFDEVARVLTPGGLLLITFSNRMFKTKAIKAWREATDPERLLLVEDYVTSTQAFERRGSFVSQGRPRPPDDKYAGLGIPSDPVWVVYADRTGADPTRPPRPAIEQDQDYTPEELAVRKRAVKHTLRCPYCDAKLDRFDIPYSPFCEWPNEYVYVCFNNDCPYLVGGWQVMNEQGNPGYSYRLMYNPDSDACLAVPEASVKMRAQGVVAPRG